MSESLRCYAGKGGGKFQDCHPDFGYKTCFSKFENGEAMTNILMNSKKIFFGEDFLILIPLLDRRTCGSRLLDQEADVVRGMRGA